MKTAEEILKEQLRLAYAETNKEAVPEVELNDLFEDEETNINSCHCFGRV